MGHHGKSTVRPELSLGAEAMRRSNSGYYLRYSDRAQPWDFGDQLIGWMFLRFLDHFSLGLLSKPFLTVKLFVKAADPSSERWHIHLCQPLISFALSIHLLALAAYCSASESGLQPVLRSRCVTHQLVIPVYQLFQPSRATLPVIDSV